MLEIGVHTFLVFPICRGLIPLAFSLYLKYSDYFKLVQMRNISQAVWSTGPADTNSKECCLRPALNAEFSQDVADMCLDCFLGDMQAARDLFVRLPTCNKPQYLGLTLGEIHRTFSSTHCLHQTRHCSGSQLNLPCRCRLDRLTKRCGLQWMA